MGLKDTIAILVPSKVVNSERFYFAEKSFESLRSALAVSRYKVFAVHDSPSIQSFSPKFFHKFIPSIYWSNRAERLYLNEGAECISGLNQGSAGALLVAARRALADGNLFGFIHLDDHVYCESFGSLLTEGLEALQANESIKWIRFSGFPIIYNEKKLIEVSELDSVEFEHVKLRPIRNKKFTIWASPFAKEVNAGGYWPIALWFCLYRLDFLIEILEYAVARGAFHLAHAEVIFKSGGGFSWIIESFPDGLFGYINMQFGGIEMHQNKNWKQLIKMPNEKIL